MIIRLRHHRKKIGLTQEQLSERSGVPQSLISDIENALVSSRIDTLLKLASALDISIADLVEQSPGSQEKGA